MMAPLDSCEIPGAGGTDSGRGGLACLTARLRAPARVLLFTYRPDLGALRLRCQHVRLRSGGAVELPLCRIHFLRS